MVNESWEVVTNEPTQMTGRKSHLNRFHLTGPPTTIYFRNGTEFCLNREARAVYLIFICLLVGVLKMEYQRKEEKTVLDKDAQNHNKAVGMKKAELSAGKKWQNEAVEFVKSFPDNGKEYKIEACRYYNENYTILEDPPHNCSYGPLVTRCVSEGVLIPVGNGPGKNSRSHGAHVDTHVKAEAYRVYGENHGVLDVRFTAKGKPKKKQPETVSVPRQKKLWKDSI